MNPRRSVSRREFGRTAGTILGAGLAVGTGAVTAQTPAAGARPEGLRSEFLMDLIL
jgi:hypothetical protein